MARAPSLALLLALLVSVCCVGAYADAAAAAAGNGDKASPSRLDFSKIVVFGDSLSDNGNGSFLLTHRKWPAHPAYFNGRFSNGPVWVEYLSSYLGAAPPAVEDSAYGGATTDNAHVQGYTGYNSSTPVPSVLEQVQAFLAAAEASAGAQTSVHASQGGSVALDSAALYVLGGGGNDVFFSGVLSSPAGDAAAQAKAAARNASSALLAAAGQLAQRGATHFLLAARPDLANSPYARESLSEEKRALLSLFADTMWADLQDKSRWPARKGSGEKTAEKVSIALLDVSQLYNIGAQPAHTDTKAETTTTTKATTNPKAKQCPFPGAEEPLPSSPDDILFMDTEHACLRGVYPGDNAEAEPQGEATGKGKGKGKRAAKGKDTATATLCQDPENYLFWDIYHPTTRAHSLLARMALDALRTACGEEERAAGKGKDKGKTRRAVGVGVGREAWA